MSHTTLRWRPAAAVVLLAVLALQPVLAQEHDHEHVPSRVITLEEIIERISSENPDLRAARLHAEALGQVPDQVAAWPDPMISAGYQPIPMLTAHGTQRSQWTVEQTVPYPGKLALHEEVARLDAQTASFESDAVLEELILQAKVAYFELYRLNEIERLIARFETDLQGFEDVTAVRYEVGAGPQQALLKVQLEKNQLRQRLHHVEGARRRAAETLARLTNAPEGPRYYLTAEPQLSGIDGFDPISLAKTAVDRRPEMAALTAAAERAARRVDLARKEAYPDFQLRLTYYDIAAADMPASANGRDAVAVGASVRIPLQRSRIKARVEEARLRQAQIEAKQQALRTEYRTQVEELLAALDHQALTIDEFNTVLLPQATSMVEATTHAYSTGTAGFLDLLDAERSVFALQTGYVDAVTQYLKQSARLERVLGIRDLNELRPSPTAQKFLTP